MTGWQPIETAPKDGTAILGRVYWSRHQPEKQQRKGEESDGHDYVAVEIWWHSEPDSASRYEPVSGTEYFRFVEGKEGGNAGWTFHQSEKDWYFSNPAKFLRPTHWAPLPPPPEDSQ